MDPPSKTPKIMINCKFQTAFTPRTTLRGMFHYPKNLISGMILQVGFL